MLAERLADALDDAAMDLAVDDHRIDRAADVIDGGIADQFDDAGLGVDFDLADMAAIGEGGEIDGLVAFGGERPAQFVGKIVAPRRLGGDFEDPERAVGALDREAAVDEFDIGRVGLQDMARDLQAFGDDVA